MFSWIRSHLEELIVTQLVKKFPARLLWNVNPVLSQLNSVLTLRTHLFMIRCNVFPSTPKSPNWSLPFKFATKILYAFVMSYVCCVIFYKTPKSK
jgi:hypothetical protein